MVPEFGNPAYKMTLDKELAKLSRMKKMLNLSADQEQAISTLMTNEAKRVNFMLPIGERRWNRGPLEMEAETKALLTPEQLAAYPEFVQAERTIAANNNAKNEASQIAGILSLPTDQQEKLRGPLYEFNLKGPDPALAQRVIAQSTKTGKMEDLQMMAYYMQKLVLEEKLKNLAGLLSPEQITTYQQTQMDRLDKMYNPPKPAKAAN
jgi:hypothetical protein